MADNVQPVWEWTFPPDWHKSFFGRRWVEFHDGVRVEPTNGCAYFWTCVLATTAWMLRGALIVASPIFKTIFFPFVLIGRGVRRVAPSVADTAEGFGERYVVPAAKSSGKTAGTQIGLFLRLVGRHVLHPVFLGRYSPLRLAGRGILTVLLILVINPSRRAINALLEALDRWDERHPGFAWFMEKQAAPMLIGAYLGLIIIGLIVLLFLKNPILAAMIFGSILSFIAFLAFLYLFFTSEFEQTVMGMAKAIKHRYCPGIRIVGNDES